MKSGYWKNCSRTGCYGSVEGKIARDGNFVFYECKKCGKTQIGKLNEKTVSILSFGDDL